MHTTSKLALFAAGFLLTLSCSTVAQFQVAQSQVVYLDDFKTSYPGNPSPYLWAGSSTGTFRTDTGMPQPLTGAGIANEWFATLTANKVANLPVGDLGSYVGVMNWSTFDPNKSGPVGALSLWNDQTKPSGTLMLEYGPRNASSQDMNLDLTPYTSLALTLDGDLDDATPQQYMVVTITLRSGVVSPTSQSWTISNDGVHQFPFNSFTFPPGFDKSSVDYIMVEFDASNVSAIHYHLVDGLRLLTGSSPETRTCIYYSGMRCYWMENTSGNYCWVPASWASSQTACRALDSCGGGGGQSGGGCYKWTDRSE